MIVKEYYRTRTDGVNLYLTYSDEGFYIKQDQTNEIYDQAIDVENSNYIYTETDVLIEDNISTDEAVNILLGGDLSE